LEGKGRKGREGWNGMGRGGMRWDEVGRDGEGGDGEGC